MPRLSVPAAVTTLLSLLTAVVAVGSGLFAFGAWYGTLLQSVNTIGNRVEGVETAMRQQQREVHELTDAQTRLQWRLERLEERR